MASPFTRKALAFLWALQRNNDREWFRTRKGIVKLTTSAYCPRTRSTPSDGLILRWTLAGSRRS